MHKTWPDYMVTGFPVMFTQNFLFFSVSHMMKQCHNFIDTLQLYRTSGSHAIPDDEKFVKHLLCCKTIR